MLKLSALLVLIGSAFAQPNLITPVSVMPKADHSAAGVFRIWDKDQAHYVGLTLGGTVSANQLWNWPTTDAAGCLQSDGSGTLSLGACGGVVNGFLVTGKSMVSPPSTAMGWQAWYNTTDHSTNWLSYDNANALSPINLSASSFNVHALTMQMFGNITANAVNTLSVGSKTTPFASGFFMGNVSSKKVEVYDAGATDLTGANWAMTANASLITHDLSISDPAGAPFLYLANLGIGATGGPSMTVHGSIYPGTFLTGADNTYDLGKSGDQWRDFFFAGRLLQGGTTWLDASGNLTMRGNITSSTVGTLGIGSKPNPFGSVFALGNVSTRKLEVDDQFATDLTGANWSIVSGASLITHDLSISDPAGAPFLYLANLGIGATGGPNMTVHGSIYPGSYLTGTDNTYDLGKSGDQWRSLYLGSGLFMGGTQVLDSGRNLTVASCTGCGGNVANGFLMTGNSNVVGSPTAQGFQASYNGSLADLRAYDNASNPTVFRITSSTVQLAGTPTIAATGNGPLTLAGSGTSNGNIVLVPGNVVGNSSVYFLPARTDQPAFIIRGIAGTTTSDVFLVQDSSGNRVFAVIGAGDATSPNAVETWDIAPIGTSGTRNLGKSTQRWATTWTQNLDVAGVATHAGNIVSTTVGTLSVGSKPNPFGSVFSLGNVSSKKLEIYDQGASDLTLANWSIVADASLLTHTLHIKDPAGADFLYLSNLTSPSSSPNLTINGYLYPGSGLGGADNTYDIGKASDQWRSLYLGTSLVMGGTTVLDSNRNLTVASCTGCGGLGVANGFFVTSNTAVTGTPTAVGLQFSHDPSSHTAFIKNFNASNALAAIDISGATNFNQPLTLQGGINMNGTPTINAAFSGTAMQIIGSNTTNGNILITPGSVAGNASVRIFASINSQPALKVINFAGSTASTAFEIDDSNQTSARFWVEASGNPTSSTSCANCVHTASIIPTADALYTIGLPSQRYNFYYGYNANFGLQPTDIPAGTIVQVVQNGVVTFTMDAFANGGTAVPSFVGRSANGTSTSPSTTLQNNTLFSFSGRGYVSPSSGGSGFTPSGSASILAQSNEDWGPSKNGADIYVQTTAPGSTFASRTTRAIFNNSGINPGQDNVYSLGTTGGCANGLTGPCRWANAQFVNATIGNLTVTSCTGCGGGGSFNPGANITFTGTDAFTQTLSTQFVSGTSFQGNGGFTTTATSSLTTAFATGGNTFLVTGDGSLTANQIHVTNQVFAEAITLTSGLFLNSGTSVIAPSGNFGVTCSGTPSSSFTVSAGIVTHC